MRGSVSEGGGVSGGGGGSEIWRSGAKQEASRGRDIREAVMRKRHPPLPCKCGTNYRVSAREHVCPECIDVEQIRRDGAEKLFNGDPNKPSAATCAHGNNLFQRTREREGAGG
ncbi:hypothetical protein AAFF_G00003660 [Aldrovandia affinis]|uniref:Uncharacterized protein n=1 Tax=Aldrovandia affinis TaxID=143900 RepID=A0AAD7TDY6_9TELE|nr:hypothetical protein AAFF_G00003660 [Aldrovandia affinis]